MDGGAPRSILASIVGWVIVGLIVFLVFGGIVGTLVWLVRMAFVLLVLGGLVWVYFRLKGDPGR